jgi:uncharacterized membrane protein
MANLKSRLLIWLLILAFAVTFATLSVRRHAALASNGLDLGNVNQALWNTAHGDFLAFTNMAPVRSRLALHVEPILLLLVPFYGLGLGGPQLLLVVQAVVAGLGALPLYWLARDELGGNMEYAVRNTKYRVPRAVYSILPLVFPLTYLLLPALEAAVMYDFHAVTLAPTFLLFAFYCFTKNRPGLFALFATLSMACKEDMGLTVAMLGLYVAVAGRRSHRTHTCPTVPDPVPVSGIGTGAGSPSRWGGLTLVAGLAWFAVAVFLIQPQFSPTGSNIQADRYAWLGETPLDMAGSLLLRPGMVWDHVSAQANLPGYLAGLLLPSALLPLLSPLAWLPALPSLAINLLSADPFTWRLEDFHYAAPMAPFVFIGAIYSVKRLAMWSARWTSGRQPHILAAACGLLLAASLAYHYARGYSPLAQPFQAWPLTEHERRAQSVFARVPSAAALFAQSNLNPHLSGRRVLYQDPTLLADPQWKGGVPAPDYLLFDVSSLVNQNDFQRFIADDFVDGGAFGPLVAEDGFLLLQRGATSEPLPDEFLDFVRAGPKLKTQYPLVAEFGDALRLHGFSLVFNREEEVQPVLYLEALRPLDEDYFLALYLLDELGAPLGATVEDQPALVWYPTRRWQPGEVNMVRFNTLTWDTRERPAYRLALGVMHGRDPWQPAARLSPALRGEDQSLYGIRLPQDGSLLELARFRRVYVLGVPAARPVGGPVEREFGPPRMTTPLDFSLGGQVRLLGYDMALDSCAAPRGPLRFISSADSAADNCQLELILYWQSPQALDASYTVFVHVVGPDGRIWAQRDSPPDSGAYPTQRWAAGEIVADPVRVPLPAQMPDGAWEVRIGMYHADSGQRLPVLDAAGQPVDDKIIVQISNNK